MKKVVIGAMAVLALTACSNEEVIQTNEQNNEITFTAVTDKATSRAADGYCNSNLPGDFQVWANVPTGTADEYKPYFGGDKFIKSGSSYINDGNYRYWPNGEIKFFACKNANPEWVTPNYNTIKADFTVNKTVASQVDFIYAVQKVASKPSTGKTEINFRHALSQVEFMAKNLNSKIYVEIIGVSVCNVIENGTFTFPESDTKPSYEDHTNTTTPTIANKGTWSPGSDLQKYAVSFDKVGLVGKDDAIASSLTTDNASGKEYHENTMYLMPQTLTTWAPATYPKPGDAGNKNGYFLLNCKIWNVAGSAFNSSTDVLIWPDTDTYANVAIPIPAGSWEQGKRYVYTFVFTKTGNGGYDPDPSGDKPEDVLVPITLDIKVDDFVKGGVDDPVNMTK